MNLPPTVLGSIYDAEPGVSVRPPLEPAPYGYLLEIAAARPLPASTALVRALVGAGFGDVVLDESPKEAPVYAEWGVPLVPDQVEKTFAATPPHLLRFVAHVRAPLRRLDGPEIAWLYARPIGLDVYAPIPEETPLVPHELETGILYEVRFVSRMRSQGRRSEVVHALRDLMGFDVLKLTALKRDMRLPGRPGASDVLWYALLRWRGPRSLLTIEDPFYFRDFVPAANVEGV